MSIEQTLEHRLSLAVRFLSWTSTRVSAFRFGFSDGRKPNVDSARMHWHNGDQHGFVESELSCDLVDALGYREGVDAAEALMRHVPDYHGDSTVLMEIAQFWAGNGNDDFDLPDAEWIASACGTLGCFLRIMPREDWIAWFVAEHEVAIESGRAGYGDLLMQDTFDHVVYVDYGDRLDIWDGWHRIGAAMLNGAFHIPVICGKPIPESIPAP